MADKKYAQHARRETYEQWAAAMEKSYGSDILEVLERYAHSGLLSYDERHKSFKHIGKFKKEVDTDDPV